MFHEILKLPIKLEEEKKMKFFFKSTTYALSAKFSDLVIISLANDSSLKVEICVKSAVY